MIFSSMMRACFSLLRAVAEGEREDLRPGSSHGGLTGAYSGPLPQSVLLDPGGQGW